MSVVPIANPMSSASKVQWDQLREEARTDSEFALYLAELVNVHNSHYRHHPKYRKRNCSLLRSIRKALEHRAHKNTEVASAANELLASATENFSQIFKTAKRLEKALERTEVTQVIALNNEYQLEKLESREKLLSVGRRLRNCLQERRHTNNYWKQIRKGEISVWLLSKARTPFAAITIDFDDNEIRECEGKNGRDLDISYELAMQILDNLNTRANKIEAFTQVGAYDIFKKNQPRVTPVSAGNREMWIWRFEREIIIAVDEHSNGQLHWSRFKLQLPRSGPRRLGRFARHSHLGSWDDLFTNKLSVEDLLQIALEYTEVANKLRGPVNDQS